MTAKCPKCGGTMEHGFTTAEGLIRTVLQDSHESRLQFVVPGAPTSPNPVTAFKQGMSDEDPDRRYLITGVRCSACGLIEFYGNELTRRANLT